MDEKEFRRGVRLLARFWSGPKDAKIAAWYEDCYSETSELEAPIKEAIEMDRSMFLTDGAELGRSTVWAFRFVPNWLAWREVG